MLRVVAQVVAVAALALPSCNKSQPASPAATKNEQAVVVNFKYGLKSLDPLFELEKRLEAAIDAADVGKYDGSEIAVDLSDGSLYVYGPDADRLFAVVRPLLEPVPFMVGATATLRYGPREAGVRESKVTIGGKK
jgi:hypothetical protein